MTFLWKFLVHKFENASWEGRFFFFLIKQYRHFNYPWVKGCLFFPPPAFHWNLPALWGTMGKNKMRLFLTFSVIKFVINWKLKCCPARLSKFWTQSHQWGMAPHCLPFPAECHTQHMCKQTHNAHVCKQTPHTLTSTPICSMLRPAWANMLSWGRGNLASASYEAFRVVFFYNLQVATTEIKVTLSLLRGI